MFFLAVYLLFFSLLSVESIFIFLWLPFAGRELLFLRFISSRHCKHSLNLFILFTFGMRLFCISCVYKDTYVRCTSPFILNTHIDNNFFWIFCSFFLVFFSLLYSVLRTLRQNHHIKTVCTNGICIYKQYAVLLFLLLCGYLFSLSSVLCLFSMVFQENRFFYLFCTQA